mgnify:CR=1 FL=1
MFAAGRLPGLSVVRVAGSDAQRFLQGQLTQDVTAATTARTVLAGWADPKGRLQWVGHLWSLPGDGLAMLVPRELADGYAAGLRRFVLRAKATVDVDALAVAAAPAALAPPAHCEAVALAGDASRALWVAPAGQPALLPEGDASAAWSLADVRAGLPAVVAATRGEFVPQMVNLDLLGGISFGKGCYPGQEIVARTRYLGRVKRRMLRYAAPGAPPPAGSAVRGPRGPAGQVVQSATSGAGAELLAVVVLDELAGPLTLADGAVLAPLPLPYAVPELSVG